MKSSFRTAMRFLCLSAAMLSSNLLALGTSILAQGTTGTEEPKKSQSPSATELFEAREFTGENGKTLKYRLLKPLDYDPERKYPLVLFLHGAGERGDDNTKQLVHGAKDFADEKRRKDFPAFIVAPQCPHDQRWSEVDWNLKTSKLPESPSESLGLVKGLLDEMIGNGSIDTKRIYITGLSMGGFGTWDAIARYPNFFAAAMPICGGGDPATADRFKKTPVWCFHGDKDFVVKVARSREMVEAIKKADGDVKYTEYPDVDHNSWTVTYANPDIYTWLFSKRLATQD